MLLMLCRDENIQEERRMCELCDLGEVESETSFLFY